jgi:hypothetical protein
MIFRRPKNDLPAVEFFKAVHDERAEVWWRECFDGALRSLIDYEMRPDACLIAVRMAAEIADAALVELEQRWPR